MSKFAPKKVTVGKLLPAVILPLAVVLFCQSHVGCVWRWLFHIPCPGCGLTRAWLAFFKGQFKQAFAYHAMFWSVPFLVAFILKNCSLFSKKWANALVLGFLAAGFLANYIWHLCLGSYF